MKVEVVVAEGVHRALEEALMARRNRMIRWLGVMVLAVSLIAAGTPAFGQAKPAEEKPKTLWEENVLFGYIENSYVWNMGRSGKDHTNNELRLYDNEDGYTFNIAEFSLKKDPSERYPFGYGLVLTAGMDSQKNHAIGIFRDDDDVFTFRNTEKFDLQEAYGSYLIPVGTGLTVKAGKFVTLLGYEVIESPNNLNFSRSFLFSFAIPLTHVGALASYSPLPWLSLTAGPVVGWDVADDNNDHMSAMGQVGVTAIKDLALTFNWITGPEQFNQKSNSRTVLDFVGAYTGIKNLTLALNVDYGWEQDEASLAASGTRSKNDASWWGWAAYAAYDWTEKLRTALRLEYFQDSDGIRTLGVGAGSRVELYDVTATLQYKIWKGLVGRLEYRHDSADGKVFAIRAPGNVPTGKTQDTLSVAFDYLFF
jgi:Putative beta-barrel porin-2, OmpL-like. bbp2